jgi:hypothetical protein
MKIDDLRKKMKKSGGGKEKTKRRKKTKITEKYSKRQENLSFIKQRVTGQHIFFGITNKCRTKIHYQSYKHV